MNTKAVVEFQRYRPDELRELYERDPEHFTELATAAIEEACIGRTWQQSVKLRQIQWYINGQLRKAKTPMEKMHVMENIFYGRIFGNNGELAHLTRGWEELLVTIQGNDRMIRCRPRLRLLRKPT